MHTTSGYDMYVWLLEMVWYLPLKLWVTEDGLVAEAGLQIQILLSNRHIFHPSPHNRISLDLNFETTSGSIELMLMKYNRYT